MQLRTKRALGKPLQIQFTCNEEKTKWFLDYIGINTTVAKYQVADSEIAIRQKWEDIQDAQNEGLTTREPE
jgi:hypothetical protein